MKSGEIQFDENGLVKKTQSHQNYLRNVDFGIVERARQALKLDKSVKSAKLTAANGNVLANVKIVTDENGKKKMEDEVNHTVFIPNQEGTDGQLKFEIDSEIVQGAKLEVEYGLKVSNISELEYINQNYYYYGSKQGYQPNANELVTLKASSIIDYLDNSMAVDESIEEAEGNKLVEGNRGELYGLLSDEAKHYAQQVSKILLVQSLSKDLRPIGAGGSVDDVEEVSIRGSRLLGNNEENLLENNAEIIKIEKKRRRSIISYYTRKLCTKNK